MSMVVGIDLGTTNTVVCAVVDGEPRIVRTSEGIEHIPSVVCYDPDYPTGFLVGQTAKDQMSVQPENVVYSVKRLMGMHYFDEEELKYHSDNEEDRRKFMEVKGKLGYRLAPDPQGRDEGVRILLGKDLYLTPVEISAKILATARREAEAFFHEEVTKAVITVPAWFEPKQIEATKRAGEMAGLEVLEILDEPSATAYACAHGLVKEARRSLVYDLGGGTFDVSLGVMREGRLRGESLGGDNWLGGDNFDDELIAMVAEKIADRDKYDPMQDREFRLIAKPAVEQAKIALSETDRAVINIANCCKIPTASGTRKPISLFNFEVTRDMFERRIRKYVDKSLQEAQKTISKSERDPDSIDEVLLVGGPTYTPCIRAAIAEKFPGKVQPVEKVHPMHCVAQGAAIYATKIAAERDGAERSRGGIERVLPYSIGIKVRRGATSDVFVPVIQQGTRLPMKAPMTKTLELLKPDRVLVAVYMGEEKRASNNRHQGNIDVSISPPAAPGTPVSIGLFFTPDRILQVTVAIRDREPVVKDLDYVGGPDPDIWIEELRKTIPMVEHFLSEYDSYLETSKAEEMRQLVQRADIAVAEKNRIECKVLERQLISRLLHQDEIANLLFKGSHLQQNSELEEKFRANLGAACMMARQAYKADKAKSTEKTRDDVAEAKRALEMGIAISTMSIAGKSRDDYTDTLGVRDDLTDTMGGQEK